MGTPPTDEKLLREAWELVFEHKSCLAAAQASGIPPATLSDRLYKAIKRLKLVDPRKTTINAFAISKVPSKERSLSELIEHRRKTASRAVLYENSIELVRIKLETSGPIGIVVFGDPHIEDDGTDFNMLERHLDIIRPRQEYVFAGNIGDVRNNWVGRLSRLWADCTVTPAESWKLVEWLFSTISWTWLVKGNHDVWSGSNDPLDWIKRESGIGITRDAGMRLEFQHPNGARTRLHARHDFPGNSIYNPLHALKRETLHGHRDHILVAGHRHIGADAGDCNPELAFQMVRVSGYKVSDEFRHAMGLKAKPLHPSAMIIVDPAQPDSSRSRAWCAPTLEVGAFVLDSLRKQRNLR